MNITIGTATLKLHKAEKNTYPKAVRSYALGVKVNGTPSEFQLTTGVGRNGEFRRYAHVKVDGTHYWAKLTDDVILADAEPTATAKSTPVAAPAAEPVAA